MSKKVSFAVIGAGSRGLYSYAPYISQHPDEAEIVAVADPLSFNRGEMAKRFNIPSAGVFSDWRELLDRPRLADVAMITVQDAMHCEVALAAVEKGYHILLEKPMGVSPDECKRIVAAVQAKGVMLCVCHVLRYAPYFKKIKSLIDDGSIGELVGIQHTEGVGWWTYAHAYVRGNWRKESESSFTLMSKSCHDIDLLNWWAGARCTSVSSYANLKHFHPRNRPANATDRCWTCPLADEGCAYSAKKLYMGMVKDGVETWPVNVLVNEFNEAAMEKALKEGPYGRCVYACDNDVVDHQVVNMDFANGVSVSFTMTAFTPGGRMTKVMGSDGYLEGDEKKLRWFSFKTKEWTEFNFATATGNVADGHGGGDFGMMAAFIGALRGDGDAYVSTDENQTLESHLITFFAEQSRRDGKTYQIN